MHFRFGRSRELPVQAPAISASEIPGVDLRMKTAVVAFAACAGRCCAAAAFPQWLSVWRRSHASLHRKPVLRASVLPSTLLGEESLSCAQIRGPARFKEVSGMLRNSVLSRLCGRSETWRTSGSELCPSSVAEALDYRITVSSCTPRRL